MGPGMNREPGTDRSSSQKLPRSTASDAVRIAATRGPRARGNHLEITPKVPAVKRHEAALLFVHGAYHGAWCWERFQEYFSDEGYATYAMNLRGHGGSDGHERLRRTSARDYVNDIAEVAATLPGSPVLIGHSMGGYLVQKYLERHQARAAVLMATMPARGGIRIFNRMLRQRPWRTIRMHLTMRPYVQIETPDLAKAFLFSDDLPDEQVRQHHARLQSESYRIGWDMSLLDVPRPGRVPRTPMLVLGARNDTLILPAEVVDTAAAYGARAEFFDMAHDMMLEEGWNTIAHRIHQWLLENGL